MMKEWGGNLGLGWTQITQLPKGLTVKGNLNLRGTPIAQLPEGLTVGGSLNLRETPITRLPKGLTVCGNLFLHGTKITQLPKGLTVNGELDLCKTPITNLPEGLAVVGNLDLRNTPIIRLPRDLTVRGCVYLNEKQIAQLPKGLTVDGILDPEMLSVLKSVSNICGPSAELEAVGRIEYLKTNGLPGEIVEYTDAEKFVQDIRERTYYGVPFTVVLYQDSNGHTIPRAFLFELDPPPKGFRVEDAPVQLENSELMNLGRTFNIDNPQESIDLATSPEGPDWDY